MYHICHVCREADTNDQIKAGCGHLIYICNDCREEQAAVQHEKCIVCKGGKTPDQVDKELYDDHMRSFDRDVWDEDLDDLFFDDLDHLEREREEELESYDSYELQ